MRTFLNVPLLDINRTYQMFAHHSCVLPYYVITYSDQVEDVEHNNASIEGEFDAKMNSFIHIKWFLSNFVKLNSTEQVLEMIWC